MVHSCLKIMQPYDLHLLTSKLVSYLHVTRQTFISSMFSNRWHETDGQTDGGVQCTMRPLRGRTAYRYANSRRHITFYSRRAL